MDALVPLSLVFCRCGRASRELLIFTDVGVVIGVAVGGFAVVGSESTCREESTCCCCIDARLVSGVEIGVVSDGRGEVVSGRELEVDVEIVVSEEASFFFEDCDFADCDFAECEFFA